MQERARHAPDAPARPLSRGPPGRPPGPCHRGQVEVDRRRTTPRNWNSRPPPREQVGRETTGGRAPQPRLKRTRANVGRGQRRHVREARRDTRRGRTRCVVQRVSGRRCGQRPARPRRAGPPGLLARSRWRCTGQRSPAAKCAAEPDAWRSEPMSTVMLSEGRSSERTVASSITVAVGLASSVAANVDEGVEGRERGHQLDLVVHGPLGAAGGGDRTARPACRACEPRRRPPARARRSRSTGCSTARRSA